MISVNKLKYSIKHIGKYILSKKYRIKINEQLNYPSLFINTKKGGDKKIIVIKRKNEFVGTFSDYIVFLDYIEFAVRNGYIPIIDRMTNKNGSLHSFGKDINGWELFFEQPMEEILSNDQKEKAIISSLEGYSINKCYVENYSGRVVQLLNCGDEDTIDYWRNIARKYIRFNNMMEKYTKKWYEYLLSGKKVLGVSVREGYTKLSKEFPDWVAGHSIQASRDRMISDAKKYIDEWNLDNIFLTCQMTDTEDMFRNTFGDRLIVFPRKRKQYSELEPLATIKNSISNVQGYRKNFRNEITGNVDLKEKEYQNEKDYVTEIYLLSRCNSLLCSHNSGSDAAFIMGNYENFKCYDIGIY